MLIGAAIALIFSLAAPQQIGVSMAYALPVTFGCWLFIDGGRLLAARWVHRHRAGADAEWPGWAWMSAVVVVGTFLGFAFGHAIGNGLTGREELSVYGGSAQRVLTVLLMSMVPGAIATWIFYTRGRMAAIEAQAQQAQRQAAEAQLKLLESQLEPHMLFNTLANLRVLIAHPSALTPSQVQGLSALAAPGGLAPWDVVVTSYGYLLRQPALREATFDLVVLDGPATGHALTLLAIPKVICDTVPEGPLTGPARECLSLLTDEARCQTVLVTLAEDLAQAEARVFQVVDQVVHLCFAVHKIEHEALVFQFQDKIAFFDACAAVE